MALGNGSYELDVPSTDRPPIFSNLYICGLTGIGKTLSVEKVIRCLLAEQKMIRSDFDGGFFGDVVDANDTLEKLKSTSTDADTVLSLLSLDYPKFRIVRISGPGMSTTDFYRVLADKLAIKLVRKSEEDAKVAVMELFTNFKECNRRKNAKFEREPVIILMIDEIDRAPREHIQDLLKIAPNAIQQHKNNVSPNNSGSEVFQPWACNIIIVGLANTIDIQDKLGITGAEYHYITQIVFEPYDPEELKSILRFRTLGLFEKRAIDMLSLKIYAASGKLSLD